jgi:UDP-2-acetamido-3-amino-2,3-dideoxy-glucuronate N-acetyltransferase
MAEPINDAPFRLLVDVDLAEGVTVHSFTNLYGCRIGAGTSIGAFVEVQRGAAVGESCKVQSHSFICEGVEVGNRVFVGHGAIFVNDKTPRATTAEGRRVEAGDWELLPIVVEDGASLGSGVLILGGVRIGENALVGAGAVVTRDVPARAVVAGVPARALPPRSS